MTAERAWRRRTRSAGDVDAELVESWLRCLDHMRRSPDLAWFPALRRRTGLAAAAELLATEQLGEHLRIRLQSARDRLGAPVGSAGEQQADARARFVQSESLSGVLNYRHGRMHGRDDLDRRTFDRLRAWHLAIGATADAARVPLLPGAASHYTLAEQWRSIADVDFSMWHRLRLVVRANAHRLRQALRRTT